MIKQLNMATIKNNKVDKRTKAYRDSMKKTSKIETGEIFLRDMSYPQYSNLGFRMYYTPDPDRKLPCKNVRIENTVTGESLTLPFISSLYEGIGNTLIGRVTEVAAIQERDEYYNWQSQYSWDKNGNIVK